jgi:drug/metabolite transporter (DMT)-like permease
VISAITFGALPILVRFAYDDGMDAPTILSLRFTLAALLLLGVLALRKEALPRGRVLMLLFLMGAVGYTGQAFAYVSALKYASTGLVALLVYLYPAIVVGLVAAVSRQRIQPLTAAVLGLALGGLALTASPQGGQALGIALALLVAVIYSLYIMAGDRVMRSASAIQSSVVIFAAAGMVATLIMLVRGPQLPTTGAGWAIMAGIVVIATMVPVATFLAGVARIGPANASMLSILEPLVIVVLGVLFLGESLGPVTLLGGALILASVVVLGLGQLRRLPPGGPPAG